MNLQIVNLIHRQFLLRLKSLKSLLYQPILAHILLTFQIQLNDKISMLKHKKVDTNVTTLGQINQAELIRAICTSEQVDYKTEISNIHTVESTALIIFCRTHKMGLEKTHSRKNNKQRAQTAN